MDTNTEIKYCLECGVPLHLHATCCGWANAHFVIYPKNELEAEWKRRKEEASGIKILTDGSFITNVQPQLTQAHVMGSACDIVKWISKCPYNIDEATIPKAGIDTKPEQVVLNLSLSYKVWLDLQEVAKHCP